jgi:hypothetical protein
MNGEVTPGLEDAGTGAAPDGGAQADAAAPTGAAGTAGTAPATGMAGTGGPTTGMAGAAGTPGAAGRPGSAGTTAPKPDGGAPPEAGAPPTPGLNIVFPPAGAVSTDTIVVRGTSALASPVGAIRVNGVAATSTDAFATFRAVVPLALGDNTISVTAEGKTGGALGQASVAVRRFADDASILRGGGDPWTIFRLFAFAVDGEQREAINCDDIFDGLVRIDLLTGNRSLASASESSAKGMVGKGYNDIAQPRDVTLDRPGHALLVDDGKLVGVDLATGDRALISGPTAGSGPTATQYGGLGFDEGGKRTIALDYGGNALFAIDGASGARSILSSATVGTGMAFNGFGQVELDLARHRALTTRAFAAPIVAIDLTTGNRSVLSGDGAGTGPALVEPGSLAVAAAAGTVFAWDKTAKHIVAVDLGSGNRRVLADETMGSGTALAPVESMAFGRDLLYVRGGGRLLAIDPIEGHRVVVSK